MAKIVWKSQQVMANELGVSVQTVHNWIRRGKVKSKKDENTGMTLVKLITPKK